MHREWRLGRWQQRIFQRRHCRWCRRYRQHSCSTRCYLGQQHRPTKYQPDYWHGWGGRQQCFWRRWARWSFQRWRCCWQRRNWLWRRRWRSVGTGIGRNGGRGQRKPGARDHHRIYQLLTASKAMALTYEQSATLMKDPVFVDRVKVAVLKFADYVFNEPTNTPAHNTRVRWAQQTTGSPDTAAQQTTPPVVMDSAVQSAGAAITDDALQASVETVIQRLM